MQTKNDIVTLCETCVCQPVCDIYCAIGPVGYCRHYYAEPVHAKWEKDPDERRISGHIYDYRCSACHGSAHKGYYGNKDYFTRYCHHCGAKMELGKENN